MAGRVLPKIIYVLVRRILGLAELLFRKDTTEGSELLVARHENAALRRQADRVRYEPAPWASRPVAPGPGAANPCTTYAAIR